MNTALRVSVLVAGLFASTALMAAENPGCPEVKFSQAVLDKFPRAQEACLDVISKGGEQYAVFKADLTGVQGNTVRVRFKLPDGSYSEPKSIRTNPKLRVLVDGKPYTVSELAPNQELTTYIRVDQPMVALAPADESEPVQPVPLTAPEPATPDTRLAAAPAMPHTASQAALPLLMGLFCGAIAFALRITRRRG